MKKKFACISILVLGLYGCAPDHAPDPEPQKKESINSNAQTVPAFSPAPVRDVKRVPIRLSSKPLAKSFKGISLGMTLDQLKNLHPKVDRDDVIIDSDFPDCTIRSTSQTIVRMSMHAAKMCL